MVTAMTLMGASEVAAHLGVTKQQVNNLRRAGQLPTPMQVLAQGPVWDAEAIRQFAATWERKPGRQQSKWRYVEVTYRLPGDTADRWAGHLTQARSPKEALAHVHAAVLDAHPDAAGIEEFLQRTITEAKAARIRAAMADRSWTGWDFGTEGI